LQTIAKYMQILEKHDLNNNILNNWFNKFNLIQFDVKINKRKFVLFYNFIIAWCIEVKKKKVDVVKYFYPQLRKKILVGLFMLIIANIAIVFNFKYSTAFKEYFLKNGHVIFSTHEWYRPWSLHDLSMQAYWNQQFHQLHEESFFLVTFPSYRGLNLCINYSIDFILNESQLPILLNCPMWLLK
jgi:hypothetical protein